MILMHTRPSRAALVALAAAVGAASTSTVLADQYDAPSSYYSSINGQTGLTLKSALHDIIDSHSTVSYDNARIALQVLDADLTQPDHMILIYTNQSLNLATITGGTIPGWDNGVTWNREHTWPRSRQINGSGSTDTGPDNSDLHLLRPAGSADNGDRGTLNFGGAGTVAGPTGGYYFPGNAHKGDVARGAFYGAVRYDDSDANTDDMELVNGNPAIRLAQMGDLQSLLRYHYEDTPDTWERRRNDLIHRPDNWGTTRAVARGSGGTATYTQGNRNPFIDHPEWVWSVFGDNANDSRLSVATPDASGASSASINFTPVIVGAAVGNLSQAITLSKGGDDPTYFEVTTAGLATSSVTGRNNAFSYGAASRQLMVGLSGVDTLTPGLRTGSVVVNNLDITNSGGGTGSLDGNDTVSLALSVLAHSNASFASGIDDNTLNLDLGNVTVGLESSLSFEIFNLVSAAGFTAGLDIDAISAVGDVGVLSTDLAMLSGLDAGTSAGFNATFAPVAPGNFTAVYSIVVSDEDLAGAIGGTELTLTLTGTGVFIPEPATAMVMAWGLIPLMRRRRRAM